MDFHFRQGIKNIPEICFRYGVQKVVISPGSRNAPLIFAFAEHGEMDCLSITDERSAAYFALGMAQQDSRPVALVCTSGTAVLNYAPAISEAYYQHLPLLIFTVDRPQEMIDQTDGQTLRQDNIFANYIKASFTIPVETVSKTDLKFSDRQVAQAIDTALTYPQGPVHINVPVREPVYSSLPETHSQPKIIKTTKVATKIEDTQLQQLQTDWTRHKRKLIVFGIFPKNEAMNELADKLSKQSDVVVIAENLSNINGEYVVTQPESLFSRINNKTDNSKFAPDLLVTIGNSAICKQLKIFLRNHPATEQWQVESTMPYADTYHSLTKILPVKATDVLPLMLSNETESSFANLYQSEVSIMEKQHQAFVNSTVLSDMTITKAVLEQIPQNAVLQLSNSTPVRWTQLFPAQSRIAYFCNRGVSGIDGSLATAAGYAFTSDELTVFLTGDLSFIYGTNGLWNNHVSNNLKIIVMNNNGGNIFRFIGDKQLMSNCLELFTTPHHVKIKSLAEAYGIDYLSCSQTEELSSKIDTLFNSTRATILEIFTDSDTNTEAYRGYFRNVKL
ncbi:MAG: 2-succinyl-5-enolpyruvyl-6-hydroxy-3-cyclohexene-1-carboxylic-acid synthase [Bacteroidia bacterium]|nr:2-succinyl-5-enolpyruvyl-6-hydroxy-3-cyclohexene-1-carboxylic-acid synthase [Bacteroidia bacterium]